jgi:hypothetical protein
LTGAIWSRLQLIKAGLSATEKKQYWSAYARVLHNLRSIFTNAGQFEDEAHCLAELRKAVRNDRYWGAREKFFRRRWGLAQIWVIPRAFLRRLGSWYFALGVRSLTSAVLLLLLWTLVFARLLWATHTGDHELDGVAAVESSILSLITIEPTLTCRCNGLSETSRIIMLGEMAVAYVHLGLLGALTYQWISRR